MILETIEMLNPAQREAVEQTEGPILILAGAGSGKTRVLTTRIGYLMKEKKVKAENILAITFTNKAANEMRERVDETLNDEDTSAMWITTFHSCCVRILRKSINKIGYNRSFVIYDSSDQVTLVKDCLRELNYSEKAMDPKYIISVISNAKDKLINPKQFREKYKNDFSKSKIADVYALYQDRLKRNSALDFDDLISKTVELFREHEDVLDFYRNRFRYIMVDEYQDTSRAQYELVRLLAQGHQNICVVGDDDQSIYGWRGADIRNILEFERDYDDVHVIKLEQNYRSTQIILDAANYLIKNNIERKRKKLWSEKKEGELIKIQLAETEVDEAEFVANTISTMVRTGERSYKDFAVLYRANAQARPVEDALNRAQIPYNIYGGTKFYERKEIKDMVAYLRVIQNPQDDISLKRIINVPRRGIGLRTIEKIEDRASLKEESIYSVLIDIEDNSDISRKARASISEFVDLMSTLRSFTDVYTVSQVIEKILDVTGYKDELLKEKNNEGDSKLEENSKDKDSSSKDSEVFKNNTTNKSENKDKLKNDLIKILEVSIDKIEID